MRILLSAETRLDYNGQPSPFKVVLFLLITAAWLLPGLTGHTPWKYDEAVSQGIIHGLVQGGQWLSPELAGEPYLAHPPLYYWLGALLVKALQGILPNHDAARLASGVFMVATFFALGVAARQLYGPRLVRLAILVFIGCAGLLIRAHEMSADLAWLTGVAWVVAALTLARQPAWGGIAAGLGLGIAFLSQGPLAFVLLLPPLLLAPLLIPACRPARPLLFLGLGLLSCAPFVVIWPLLLYKQAPDLFALWQPVLFGPLAHPSHFLVPDAEPLYYLGVATWFAWPAFPLALGTLWNGGTRTRALPQTRLLLLLILLWIPLLGLLTSPREGNALPLLVPFTLLAVGGVEQLRRGAASALDWFGMLTFGLITTLLWLGWIAQLTGWPRGLVHYLDRQLPGYQTHFQPLAFAVSLALTLLWILTTLRSKPSARRALINWTVGMTVTWCLVMTLWLPYVEASRSYEGMLASLSRSLPADHGCVRSTGLGEPQRGLLFYSLDLATQRTERGRGGSCRLWLIQRNARDSFLIPAGWHLRWSGARPGDHIERYELLEQ